MTKVITCRLHENCAAPLCPLYSGEKGPSGIWYPDEEICRKRRNTPTWIIQQRKIAKKATPENLGYYFSFTMLKVPFRVTNKVIGLNPDLDMTLERRQLRSWRKRNKGVKRRKRSSKAQVERRSAFEPGGETEDSRWAAGARGPPSGASQNFSTYPRIGKTLS